MLATFEECCAIGAHNGFAPRQAALQHGRAMLTKPGSPMAASMFKDIQRNAPVETDHIVGDLLARTSRSASAVPSVLRMVYVHLKAYEAQRARTAE